MKPTVDMVLLEAGKALTRDVLPATTDAHIQGTLHMLSVLLRYSATEYERGADNRMANISAMKSIFRDAAGVVSDRALALRLDASAEMEPSSLRISELDRVGDCLKLQFIELHEHVEDCDAAWARPLEKRLLDFLAKSQQRGALAGPFEKMADELGEALSDDRAHRPPEADSDPDPAEGDGSRARVAVNPL